MEPSEHRFSQAAGGEGADILVNSAFGDAERLARLMQLQAEDGDIDAQDIQAAQKQAAASARVAGEIIRGAKGADIRAKLTEYLQA